MRAVLALLMSVCGLASWIEGEVRWAMAMAEREMLALHVYSAPPVAYQSPTPFAMPAPVLHAGMHVRVQMLEGEWLNLRDAPGMSGNVVAMLGDGTRLTLLEGPYELEGRRWWKVFVGGREGWCVEHAGDVLAITLLPPETAEP